MKKLLVAVIFLLSFIISLLVFMPYKKIYSSIIDSAAKRGNVEISYRINQASLTGLDLKNIEIITKSRVSRIDSCKVAFNPLGLVGIAKLANIKLYIGKNRGEFNISKNKKKYIVSGVFKTPMLSCFLDKDLSGFLKSFNGVDTLHLTLTYQKNRIVINELKITGDFELVARGYIQSGVLRLMGVVKIGKIKENFSI